MNTPSPESVKNIRRSSLGRMMQQSTMLLMLSIGSLILLLALIILFHENANATEGYRLRTLERERNQLHLEREVLNMQIAEAQSLENLSKDSRISIMLTPKKPTYIDPLIVPDNSLPPPIASQ
jgi:hypothetical protein